METPTPPSLKVLAEIEQRVLWLAVRMVDSANHDRPADEIKVGGHQASSASMVSLMTALWFGALRPGDKVAVKPHASPVHHAIQYLLGNLDRSYLTELRALGGLQAYPSRTKDPDPVDFSTGSVGLGPAAVLFAAVAERYVRARGLLEPTVRRQRAGRYIAVMGDAELDEGNVWEAIADPATQQLGNVLWVVDLNRQSLDRVVPGIKADRLQRMFHDNGWHVVEAKYGRRLNKAFGEPGGQRLRDHIDQMSNEQYQSLFALRGRELRERFLEGADVRLRAWLDDVSDKKLPRLVLNLGGHDLGTLLDAYARADLVSDRPSVVFAYTIKGWGLPIAGDPLNHSALLRSEHIVEFRKAVGLEPDSEWDRLDPSTPAGQWCEEVGATLRERRHRDPLPGPPVPTETGASVAGRVSTQEAFGRALVGLTRHPEVASRIVTTSPDVSVSTNLGGWINKTGVFAAEEKPDWFGSERVLHWQPSPSGQHLELGLSEMNLFLLLCQLGLTAELLGPTLLPIGTVYDPFVVRGLDAFVYAAYSGAKFVIAGTPSGVTLSHEGGAHQSTITASIGMELPGVVFAEPAYARALDWLLCDGLARLTDRVNGESLYLRLGTRPIDQTPFAQVMNRRGEAALRHDVLAGGYRIVEPEPGVPAQALVLASGSVLPEALAAAAELDSEGVPVTVIDVTSADRLQRPWLAANRAARASARRPDGVGHLATLIEPHERTLPMVTVHDAHPHAMAWLGSVFGQPVMPIGVEDFGQSGTIADLYRLHHLDAAPIVNAVLGLC